MKKSKCQQAKVTLGKTTYVLTHAVGRKVAKLILDSINLKPESKMEPSLTERLFNVRVKKPLCMSRKLSASEIDQKIIHFGQPDGIPDKRFCGIPITVELSDFGIQIETRLVPQWRFGTGMRGSIVGAAMKGKTRMKIEEKNGKLALSFS